MFIILAIEDGADPEAIETRVTHTGKVRNRFDGYNCGLHWELTCGEILKLRITRGPQTPAIPVKMVSWEAGRQFCTPDFDHWCSD